MSNKRARLLVQLGLTGSQLKVTRDTLVSTDQRLHVGCYFLYWEDRAITWSEPEPATIFDMGKVYWISAHALVEVRKPYSDEPSDTWVTNFQALQPWATRHDLLMHVGFPRHTGPFYLMETVPMALDQVWFR